MKTNLQTVEKVKSATLALQRFHWEQGCFAQALLEFEGLTDDVMRLCEAMILRNNKDGRVGVMEKNESVTDPASIGEALILSVEKTANSKWKEAVERLYFYLKYRAPRTRDGILFHLDLSNQVWVDAYYMAPPFLCKYGDIDEAMIL